VNSSNLRIGHGFDLHQLVEGRKLILGGIEIPHPLGLLGHSDADCLIHALADAILGALALPDIGHHFPDQDPQNRDLDSSIILAKAVQLAKDRGYSVGNVDLTVIAEKPKLGNSYPRFERNYLDYFILLKTALDSRQQPTKKLVLWDEKKGLPPMQCACW